jgi:hypothetical protein
MSITIKTTTGNGMLDYLNTQLGASPRLRVYTAAFGTLLADIPLAAAGAFAAGSGGAIVLTVPEEDSSADAGGTAAVFDIATSGGTAHIKGSVTATGGGGDLTIASTTIVATQPVRVTGLTLNLSVF